jgi:pimeloyl-ACP methyl ester carboxylesterase
MKLRFALPTDGAVVPYVDDGSGPCVVLVHGALTDLRMWEPHRALLRKRHRTIACTLRYFGTEPWQEQWPPFGIETHAADLMAFVRLLNLGPVHLVAWSYSGHAVLTAALRHPEHIRSAFIYEPGVPTYVDVPAALETFAADAEAMFGPVFKAVQSGDLESGVRRLIDGSGGRQGYFDSQSPERRAIQLDNARTLPLLLDQAPPPVITAEHLRSLEAPICIAWGAATRPLFRVVSEAAAGCIPGGRHRVIAGADHMWPDTDPAGFAASVSGFIADVEAQGPGPATDSPAEAHER